jgi:succinyl-CoA synthetase alpha subunit
MIQGITGREASIFTLDSLEYGARIVSGVTPGKGGNFVHGVPVFDTVAEARKARPCDATVISVPSPFVRDAAFEAIASGIKLLVIVTENVPRADTVMVLEQAEKANARVIGPNCLGIISPGRTRIGMCGGAADYARIAFSPGNIGIISRSGGMTTEIANLLTGAGAGQSTCVSIGGDPIVGSSFVDLLPLFEEDPETKGLVLFCEPGGIMEERLADHLKHHGTRLPIIAFIAGRFTDQMKGTRFGHAGAIVEENRGSPIMKTKALGDAGVKVALKLRDIPQLVLEIINQ